MSIKLILLKSGENIVTEAKELFSGENPCGYLFENPYKVVMSSPVFMKEETNDSSVQISISPWMVLSEDKNIAVPPDWVVTVVEPIESLKKMYEESVNGKNS